MNWSSNKRIRVIAGRAVCDAISDIAIKGKILLLSAPVFESSGLLNEIISRLQEADIQLHVEEISNPDINQLDGIAKLYRHNTFDWILAVGGGSIIDAAKVISVIAAGCANNSILDDLRKGEKARIESHVPMLAVPTTSGTGAEFTQFATVWDMKNGNKFSFESEFLIPGHVILDPNLTIGLPRNQTLFTGLDALSHATESLWNKKFNPLARACAKESINTIIRELPVVLEQPSNTRARAAMQNASFLSGIAISQAKTAIAHAISYPLTYRFSMPHGLACSFTIPALCDLLCAKGELDQDILDYIKLSADFIKSLGLSDQILHYAKPEELLSMLDEMNNPQRFSNFVLSVNRDELGSVLRSSLGDPTA